MSINLIFFLSNFTQSFYYIIKVISTYGKFKCKILFLFRKAYLTIFAKSTILISQSELCKKENILKTKIRELRKNNRISQDELAKAVGVTRQTITSIECEKYTASLVLAYKIAKYFGLTIEDVFDLNGMEN